MFIFRYPFIGASPDGILDEYVIEIKCPMILKDTDPDDLSNLSASQKSNFCCHKTDEGLKLKKNHPYYSQIQCQMFVTGFKKGLFVI